MSRFFAAPESPLPLDLRVRILESRVEILAWVAGTALGLTLGGGAVIVLFFCMR